jgi:serine/threonine protein kinase
MYWTLEGLLVMHAAGLAHLDLKPGNVIMTEDGRAKVADFGAACAIDQHTGKLAVQTLRRDQQVDKLVVTLESTLRAASEGSAGGSTAACEVRDTLTAADVNAAKKDFLAVRSCPGEIQVKGAPAESFGASGSALEEWPLGLGVGEADAAAGKVRATVQFRCSSIAGEERDAPAVRQSRVESEVATFRCTPAYSLRDVPMVWAHSTACSWNMESWVQLCTITAVVPLWYSCAQLLGSFGHTK